jgi:hypothetical protein
MAGARGVLIVALLTVIAAPAAAAAPTWADTPALLAHATAPVAGALRACVSKLPRPISLIVTRRRDGATSVTMPLYGLGGRGMTPEERCLAGTVPRIKLPPLPAEIERVGLLHVIAAPDVKPARDPAFDDWRDPAAALARFLDEKRRAALAACSRAPRKVRLVLDLRRGATRVWLPQWQFHSPSGDGTTPPAEQRVKACLGAAIRGWRPPTLPRAMGELELAVAVAPR